MSSKLASDNPDAAGISTGDRGPGLAEAFDKWAAGVERRLTTLHRAVHPYDRLERIEDDRQWLAKQPPLPTAEELAKPFVEGIFGMFRAFDNRAEAMLHDAEGEMEDNGSAPSAAELIALTERVCSLVRSAIHFCVVDGQHPVAPDMDAVIRALADTATLEGVLNNRAIYALID